MKTLIIYASKYGFIEEVVNKIKQNITHEYSTLDIKHINTSVQQLIAASDNVVIATSMYVGTINKKMKEFIVANELDLLQKNIGIAIAGMQKDEIKNEIKSNFSEELLAHSSFVEWIGGEFNFEKMGWMDKMIVKKVANCNETTKVFFDEKIKLIEKAMENWN